MKTVTFKVRTSREAQEGLFMLIGTLPEGMYHVNGSYPTSEDAVSINYLVMSSKRYPDSSMLTLNLDDYTIVEDIYDDTTQVGWDMEIRDRYLIPKKSTYIKEVEKIVDFTVKEVKKTAEGLFLIEGIMPKSMYELPHSLEYDPIENKFIHYYLVSRKTYSEGTVLKLELEDYNTTEKKFWSEVSGGLDILLIHRYLKSKYWTE